MPSVQTVKKWIIGIALVLVFLMIVDAIEFQWLQIIFVVVVLTLGSILWETSRTKKICVIGLLALFTIGAIQIQHRTATTHADTKQMQVSTAPLPKPAVDGELHEYYATEEPTPVPSAPKGRYWHIELKDPNDVVEFSGFNVYHDGTVVSVGPSWRLGGKPNAMEPFPSADRYLIKAISRKEVRFYWSVVK